MLYLPDWVVLTAKWFHLLAGIAWIGSSFFFVWLDASLRLPPEARKDSGIDGQLWMVHSGGFYQVNKRRIGPGFDGSKLHWFKWEAAFTWLTGFALLWLVFYSNPGRIGVQEGSAWPLIAKVLGTIGLAWFVYDRIWVTKFFTRHPMIGHSLSGALLLAIAALLFHLLPGPAALLHLGATMGTLMVANVWVRIIPNQNRMIQASLQGKEPDYAEGERAKSRSMHNSYMTLPTVLLMISGHFPHLAQENLLLQNFILIFVLGASLRVLVVRRHHGKSVGKPLSIAAATTLLLLTLPALTASQSISVGIATKPTELRIAQLIATHCQPCHSGQPTDPDFPTAPLGVVFDSMADLKPFHSDIFQRVVVDRSMPLANKTGMTDDERQEIAVWYQEIIEASR